MSEWYLISLLVFIVVLASTAMIYPLRRYPKLGFALIPIVWLLVGVGYVKWGGFFSWRTFVHQQYAQEQAREMMKSIKDPQQLITTLRSKLSDDPQSAKGWYLLGKLYANHNDLKEAVEAFAKAYHFKPEEEEFAVHYAYSLWQENNQQFNAQIRGLFAHVLDKNPKQPDALAMLAMEAFSSHAYEQSIGYWQRLLELAPAQSDEAKSIRKAIARAQEKLDEKVAKE